MAREQLHEVRALERLAVRLVGGHERGRTDQRRRRRHDGNPPPAQERDEGDDADGDETAGGREAEPPRRARAQPEQPAREAPDEDPHRRLPLEKAAHRGRAVKRGA